jgi:hypothetical protein
MRQIWRPVSYNTEGGLARAHTGNTKSKRPRCLLPCGPKERPGPVLPPKRGGGAARTGLPRPFGEAACKAPNGGWLHRLSQRRRPALQHSMPSRNQMRRRRPLVGGLVQKRVVPQVGVLREKPRAEICSLTFRLVLCALWPGGFGFSPRNGAALGAPRPPPPGQRAPSAWWWHEVFCTSKPVAGKSQ